MTVAFETVDGGFDDVARHRRFVEIFESFFIFALLIEVGGNIELGAFVGFIAAGIGNCLILLHRFSLRH